MQSYQYSFYDFFYTLLQRLPKRDTSVSKKQEGIMHKQYSKNDLDKILEKHGFTVLDYVYNNFRIIPHLFEFRRPSVYIRISEFLTRVCPRHFGFFAANYIAKYQLNS